MGAWMLTIFQGESSLSMAFSDFDEVTEYMETYGENYGNKTRFVIMNDSGPDVEVNRKYHFKDEEVPLPDGF